MAKTRPHGLNQRTSAEPKDNGEVPVGLRNNKNVIWCRVDAHGSAQKLGQDPISFFKKKKKEPKATKEESTTVWNMLRLAHCLSGNTDLCIQYDINHRSYFLRPKRGKISYKKPFPI